MPQPSRRAALWVSIVLLLAGCASTDDTSARPALTDPPAVDVADTQAAGPEPTPIDDSPEPAPATPSTPASPVPDLEAAPSPAASPVPDLEAPASASCAPLDRAAVTTAGPASGNPLVDPVDLRDPVIETVELPGPAAWVIGSPTVPGEWVVQLVDGTVVRVGPSGVIETATTMQAPIALMASGDVVSAYRHHDALAGTNPGLTLLPDTRVVSGRTATGEGRHVALTAPTDRYAHAVLGDRIEASGIGIFDDCGQLMVEVTIAAPDVIEEVAPLLADIDGDGGHDIVVTLSNSEGGARLAVYALDGTPLGETVPIGRGNRWRNQLGVGPTSPDGEIEVIDVRTPHIGGRVQFFALVDGRLERAAASGDSYTTHTIGSRNLDMGVVADADADGALDAVLFTSDRRTLVALARRADRVERVVELPLAAPAVSNLARHPLDPTIAVATADGQLWLATER